MHLAFHGLNLAWGQKTLGFQELYYLHGADRQQIQRAVSSLDFLLPQKSQSVPRQWYKSVDAKPPCLVQTSGFLSLSSLEIKLFHIYLHLNSLLRFCTLENMIHKNSLLTIFCWLWKMMSFLSWMRSLLKLSGDDTTFPKASTLSTGQLEASFVSIHH